MQLAIISHRVYPVRCRENRAARTQNFDVRWFFFGTIENASGGNAVGVRITHNIYYLARILFAFGISGAYHVGRDAFLVVFRLLAIVVAHDRHVHLVQYLRRGAALFFRSPAGDDALVTGETLTWKTISSENRVSTLFLFIFLLFPDTVPRPVVAAAAAAVTYLRPACTPG